MRSVLQFTSGFFPTRPHGARKRVSRRVALRAVASGSRLLPTRPVKDFHLQSSAHAGHTSRLILIVAPHKSSVSSICKYHFDFTRADSMLI